MTFAVLAAAAFTFAAAPVQALAHDAGALRVTQPWVRAAPPGAPTMAGYLTITNRGRSPDRLLGGSSPDFAAVEVHQMTMTGQIMRMRPIAGGLSIGPGRSVALSPGGELHLMLIGPKHAFRAGDHVRIALRFEKAGMAKVNFLVRDSGPGEPEPMHPTRTP